VAIASPSEKHPGVRRLGNFTRAGSQGYLSYVTPGRGIPEIKFRLRKILMLKSYKSRPTCHIPVLLYGPARVSHAVFSVKIIEKEKILRQFTDFRIHSARYSGIQFSKNRNNLKIVLSMISYKDSKENTFGKIFLLVAEKIHFYFSLNN
jgi:hypothetical protein